MVIKQQDCDEVARLSTEFDIITVAECSGLTEDFVSCSCEFFDGRQLSIEGPISWVLPILRIAQP